MQSVGCQVGAGRPTDHAELVNRDGAKNGEVTKRLEDRAEEPIGEIDLTPEAVLELHRQPVPIEGMYCGNPIHG